MSIDDPAASRAITLVELVDRLLGKGVVIAGDITLAVADIDLVRVELRALIASVDALEPAAEAAVLGAAP